jgi:FixJ family two-component response regulator
MTLPESASEETSLHPLVATPTVFVVDPDSSVRSSLESLICRQGWRAKMLTSAEEFVAQFSVPGPSCLVSDVSLPGLSGLELQARVADRPDMPLIFLATHFDIPIMVRAIRAGAVEFLVKPVADELLLDAIRSALELSRIAIPQQRELRTLRQRYGTLSQREREVMALVVLGLLNKQVATQLSISEITVKAHRGKLMRKMGVSSLAQLVVVAVKLNGVSLSRGMPAPARAGLKVTPASHSRQGSGVSNGHGLHEMYQCGPHKQLGSTQGQRLI